MRSDSEIFPVAAAPSDRPLRELLALALPTVAQMASYTLMQFIDTWLLSRLGHVEAAAAGMSGLFAFSIISFGFGLLQLVNTLVSQNYGRGDYPACGKYLWQGVWFALAFSVLVLPVVALARPMFRAMGHGPELVRHEAVYLQILLAATAVKLVGTSCVNFLLGVNRPRATLVAAIAGVGCNAIAAYALVLGRLGFDSHGIVGAAWAQNLGVAVETLVLVGCALQPSMRRTYGALAWRFDRAAMGALLRVGWPSGAQFVADVLAWSLFSSAVLASAGEAAMAANTFTFRFMSVSFMPAFGIGTAITALVGRYIGMGREDLAVHRAGLGFNVNLVYMLACGVVFFVWRDSLMRLFTTDPEVLRIGSTLLVFAAAYQLADALYCSYSGALRGAGDTFVPAVATASLQWTLTIGLGWYVAHRFPQWGATGPWVIATAYGLIISTFMYARFRLGYWKGKALAGPAAGPAGGVIVADESTTLSAFPVSQRSGS